MTLPELADETEIGNPKLALAVALGRNRHGQRGDNGQYYGMGGLDSGQRANLRPMQVLAAERAFGHLAVIELYDGLGAGDRYDATDRSIMPAIGPGLRGCVLHRGLGVRLRGWHRRSCSRRGIWDWRTGGRGNRGSQS